MRPVGWDCWAGPERCRLAWRAALRRAARVLAVVLALSCAGAPAGASAVTVTAALSLAGGPDALTSGVDTTGTQQVSQALFLASGSTMPPDVDAGWKPQPLPDMWLADHPGVGDAWYRLPFQVPAVPDHPWAVLLPRVGGVAQVFVNGVLIGRTSGFDGGDVSLWRRASTFSIPPSLLHAGGNTVDLRVSHDPMFGIAMEPALIGDDMAVDRAFNSLLHWRVSLNDATRILYLLLGGFTLVLWFYRRQETMYAYFGLLPIAVAISFSPAQLAPLPHMLWVPVLCLASAAVTPLSFIYCLRYAGWRWPRVEAAWWLGALAYAALECFGDSLPSSGWLHHAWVVQMPATFASLVLIAVIAWRTPNRETLLLLAGHLFSNAIAQYTWIRELIEPRSAGYLMILHLTPLCLFITWILTHRFAQTVNRYEALNARLEARVAEKHAELEHNYVQLRALEQERAIAGERSRIMREMHDGIGGQLISALSLIEHGEASRAELAAVVRECIDELRLAIDSLEPVEHELLPVLGSLRVRLEGRLQRQGIRLDWKVGDVPPLACLTPQNVLHVLRILQEAFTNTLKHANASQISLETGVSGSGEQVWIRVRDNGHGFQGTRQGRGLANMRRRAEILGGAIDIEPSPAGTLLCLHLPV